MIFTLICLFFIGYLAIALEHPLRVDKTATALLLGMLLWVIYALNAEFFISTYHGEEFARYLMENPRVQSASPHMQALSYIIDVQIVEAMGDITQTLFFLIGAMTIVELVDVHGGFSIITDHIRTNSKTKLMWILCLTAFFFSAVLDNMTTTIVMIMLLRKLIDDRQERWLYAGLIVIAANCGGAWSPIGDVTTIMLWVKGNVTAPAIIARVTLPSLIAILVPALWISRQLKGRLAPVQCAGPDPNSWMTHRDKLTIFLLGVTGLILVPVFKSITHLPPFIGMLFVLGILWLYTEIFYNRRHIKDFKQHRLTTVIKRIDMPSILFFMGILMAVQVLDFSGVLNATAQWLDAKVHNIYLINIFLGMMSSVFDNVPLVAGVMGMYPIADAGAVGYAANFIQDGVFWEFLSYCAGVGGSLLIIGSAAGVIAMGLEKISFGWYCKHFTLPALLGYLAGAGVYILEVILF